MFCGCVCVLLYRIAWCFSVILFLGQYAMVQTVTVHLGLHFVFDLYRTQKLWTLLVIELFLLSIFNVLLDQQTVVRSAATIRVSHTGVSVLGQKPTVHAVAIYVGYPVCCFIVE